MDTLGNFKIKAKIIPGGAWANVFVAEKDDKEYVLKILKRNLSERTGTIKGFFKEANLLKGLSHPNIAKVVEIGPYNQPPFYFAMEYYNKGNLETYITERGKLETAELIHIACEICKGLDYLNSKGHMHLDLKPSNILFSSDNKVVITDFGSSVSLRETDSGVTITGTPQYMSPEQFDTSTKLSFSADLYSLGIIMYQMATGQIPFQGASMDQYAMLHGTVKPFPPSSFNSGISKEIEKVILKLLEKKPQDRFNTAKEVQQKLEKLEKTIETKESRITIHAGNPKWKEVQKESFSTFPVLVSYLQGDKKRVQFNSHELREPTLSIYYSSANGIDVLVPKDSYIQLGNKKITSGRHNLGNKKTNIEFNGIPITLIPSVKRHLVKTYFALFLMLGIIGVSASLFLANQKPELKISDLKILPSELTYDEDFKFIFASSEIFSSGFKYQIKPFYNRDEIRTLENNVFNYFEEGFRDVKGTNKISVRLIDAEGERESNWLTGEISFKKMSSDIKLLDLKKPDRILVGDNIKFTFDYFSQIPDGNLQYDFVIEKNAAQIEHLKNTNIKSGVIYQFKNSGQYEVRARIMDPSTGDVSNFITKTINVEDKKPVLTVSDGQYTNNIFSFTFKLTGLPQDGSFPEYYLVLNGKQIKINPSKDEVQFFLPNTNSFNWKFQIVIDGTTYESTSKTYDQGISGTISKNIKVEFTTNPLISNRKLKFGYSFEIASDLDINKVQLQLEIIMNNLLIQTVPLSAVVGGFHAYDFENAGEYQIRLRIKYPGLKDNLTSSKSIVIL